MDHSRNDIALAEASESTLHEGQSTSQLTDINAIKRGSITEADLVDQTLYLPPAKVRLIVFSIALCFGLGALEQTILATALPSIASTFKSGNLTGWVVTSFYLSSTATSPFFGRFADIFGRRLLLLLSSAIVFLSTLACTFSRSIIQLMYVIPHLSSLTQVQTFSDSVFRAFQGIGCSGMFSLSYIVLADVVPLTERGKYQGIIEAFAFTCQATGPLLSGVLVKALNWRACFWIMLPIIALAGILQWLLIPSRPTAGDWKAKLKCIDYFGCGLVLAATLTLLIAVTRGGIDVAWRSAEIIILLAFSGILYLSFGFWEVYGASVPLLPLRLFKEPTVIGVHLSTFTSMAGSFIVLFYMPVFLQVARGLSTVTSGAAIMPYGAIISLFVFISVSISRYIGPRPLILVGHAGWAAGAGIFVTFNQNTPVGAISGALIFAAVGGGLCLVTAMMALEASVPRADRAVVLGSRMFARLLGASIGVAVAGALVTTNTANGLRHFNLSKEVQDALINDSASVQGKFKDTVDSVTYEAVVDVYVKSFQVLFWVITGLLLFAFVAALTLIRHHSMKRDDDEEQKQDAVLWLAKQKLDKQRKPVAEETLSK